MLQSVTWQKRLVWEPPMDDGDTPITSYKFLISETVFSFLFLISKDRKTSHSIFFFVCVCVWLAGNCRNSKDLNPKTRFLDPVEQARKYKKLARRLQPEVYVLVFGVPPRPPPHPVSLRWRRPLISCRLSPPRLRLHGYPPIS